MLGCLVVVIAGAGPAFCAGLDLKEFASAKLEDDPSRAAIVRHCFSALRHCALPVIAAVNGIAAGAGASLAFAADFRVLRRSAAKPRRGIGIRRKKRDARALEIAGSRSFLVDVHILKR